MKNLLHNFHIIILLLLPFLGLGQTPDFINYQAAVKQADGKPVANKEVSVAIEIETDGGSFSQSQTGMTDDFGIISLQIGGEELKDIDWAEGSARVSVSISSGAQSISLGTTPIATVPYALYAETSGSSIPGPSPGYQWDGTKLRFENPDGSFGNYVDLKGDQGNSVKVVGSVQTLNDLPTNYSGEIGDMFIVEASGEGFVWQGSSWLNIGTIQGPTGPKGDQGDQGSIGKSPEFQWSGTKIRFQNPDGTWGDFTDLLGPTGDKGDQGEKGIQGIPGLAGPMPQHEWQGTNLRFSLPQGGWGQATNLVGPVGPVGPEGIQGPPGNAGNFNAGVGISITNNTISNTGDTNANDDLTQSTTHSGEVEGTYNNLKVIKLVGKTISQTTPDEGDVLTYADGQWRSLEPQSSGVQGISAGGINSMGVLTYASPGVSASIATNIVTITISGVSLTPSTASAVITSRNGIFKVYSATFSGGTVSFTASDNELVYPMNFIIYHN